MKISVVIEPLESRALLSVAALPRYDHVVIVVEENHSYESVLGSSSLPTIGLMPIGSDDPYIRSLAKNGASFTKISGITHPSEPNYLAMFSGSTQGVTSDAPPKKLLKARSLGGELIAAVHSFAGYSEALPSTGSTITQSHGYSRSHNPWSEFADVPASANLPFSAFPTDYRKLPTVSFVVPTKSNDMHSGSISTADKWLKTNLGGYAKWAPTHNSLLIVTWAGGSGGNHIPTIFYVAHIAPGKYSEPLSHYNTLRTLEDMYGLTPLGKSAGKTTAIRDVFTK